MNFLPYTILLLLLCSCSNSRKISDKSHSDSGYLIKAIDTVNSWCIIYATKNDSSYKIVVKKEDKPSLECKRVILIGEYYDLTLHSKRNEAPVINGVKLAPVNYLDIHCYTYDERTNICIDPEKGIYDLYHTANIKGMCYIKL